MRTFGSRPLDELFTLEIALDDAHWVVTVKGDLDYHSSPKLRSCLATLQDAGCSVIVDLEHVTFIDSTGIGVIVATHRAAAEGHEVHLRSPSPATRRVLEMTGIPQLAEAAG